MSTAEPRTVKFYKIKKQKDETELVYLVRVFPSKTESIKMSSIKNAEEEVVRYYPIVYLGVAMFFGGLFGMKYLTMALGVTGVGIGAISWIVGLYLGVRYGWKADPYVVLETENEVLQMTNGAPQGGNFYEKA